MEIVDQTESVTKMEQNTLKRRGLGLQGVDKSKVCPGYTLFAHLTSPGTVLLVDNDGKEVHRWNLPYRPGRHARILPNGNLAYNGVHPDGPRLFDLWQKYRGGMMMEIDPMGNIVRQHEDPWAHHDQHHLGNGEIIYATLQELSPQEAESVQGGIPDTEGYDGKMYGDCIKHVDSNGKTIWTWRSIDHLDPKKFPLQPHYPREHWPLINSVYPLKDGNILASLRSVSAVIIISRETGEVLNHIDSTVVAQQHCASQLDNGDILIFDNGTFRHHESATYSRVIQVDPTTNRITWQYKDPHPMTFFTPFMGGAQRLPNGNTLITEAAFGRIFEVCPNGEICWEYVNPLFANYEGLSAPELEPIFDNQANAIFRAYKYTPEQIPWLGKQLSVPTKL